jgi:acetoin utilization protein AcuC
MSGPLYIAGEIYRNVSNGGKHPLVLPSVSACTDLIRALGWLPNKLPNKVYRDAPMASIAQLTRFHDRARIDALRRAAAVQPVSEEDRARFRIGAHGNRYTSRCSAAPPHWPAACCLRRRCLRAKA